MPLSALNTKVKVWIDLDNSPHVPFFYPIIRRLEEQGHSVMLTSRDCFQVEGLASYYKLEHKMIGKHYGANKALKVLGTLWRALQFLPAVLKEKPDLALSHGSRPLALVSAACRIPNILIFDYEYARSLPFLRPTLGLAPEAIRSRDLARHYKLGMRNYQGLKEDVYVEAFRPDPSVLHELQIDADKLIVTIRPPANEAHYHNPESEGLFKATVDFIGAIPEAVLVILPRNEKAQKEMILNQWPDWCRARKIIIPAKVVNGLDLIWYSDLVVSGGGTMNREAAALGVPVYSIFRGQIGAVDRYLVQKGCLTLIESVNDVARKIKPLKRDKTPAFSLQKRAALDQIVAAIDHVIRHGQAIKDDRFLVPNL